MPGYFFLVPLFQLLGGDFNHLRIILFRLEFLAPDISINRACGVLPIGRRLNNAGSAADHVASDEDALPGSHAGFLVDLDRAAFGQLYLAALAQQSEIGLLADSYNQLIRRENLFGSRDRLQLQPALDKRHLLDVKQFQTGELAVFDDDSLGRFGGFDIDTFLLGPVDLPWIRRHLVSTFEADDRDLLTAKPKRRAGTVHSNVAAADHNHVLLDGFCLA